MSQTATLTSPFLSLSTLDPAAPMDDLEPIADLIGDVRVVAIGESAHYAHEYYLLRHRLARFLVERLGFTAIALESGFSEGFLVDAWLGGGPGDVEQVSRHGITYGFGECQEMQAHLEWMRAHNASGGNVRFYGIDVTGSMGSLLPPLDVVTPFLAAVDPAFLAHLERLRELAAVFGTPDPTLFSDDFTLASLRRYGEMPVSDRNELTALLADLAARFDAMQLMYIERSDGPTFDVVRQHIRMAVQTDAAIRQFSELMAGNAAVAEVNIRDRAMADTVEWILSREERLVLLAHNGHIQRTFPDISEIGLAPTSMMGHHLAAHLGEQYLPIGTTFGSGQLFYYESKELLDTHGTSKLQWAVYDLPPAGMETIDGLMAASHSEPGILDLRVLTPEDIPLIDAASRMRYVQYELDIHSVRQAFDLLVNVPQVTVWRSPVTAKLLNADNRTMSATT
jgi:erythromycin esterase